MFVEHGAVLQITIEAPWRFFVGLLHWLRCRCRRGCYIPRFPPTASIPSLITFQLSQRTALDVFGRTFVECAVQLRRSAADLQVDTTVEGGHSEAVMLVVFVELVVVLLVFVHGLLEWLQYKCLDLQ